VKVLLLHPDERFPSCGGGLCHIAFILQKILEGLTDVRVVVPMSTEGEEDASEEKELMLELTVR
jgi:hypothetical protein